MISKKQIWVFIGVLFFVSWLIQVLALEITGDIDNERMVIWLASLMLTPMLVSIFFILKFKSFKDKLLWKPNKKIFITSFFAILVPIIIAFVVLIFLQYFGLGKSIWFNFSASSVNIKGGPFLLGKGDQSWFLFILNVFYTGAAFAFLNAFFAAGEEFAWRGLVQPLLVEKYGMVAGVTLLGIIWAMWHLPILLAGYNYPETPVLGALVLFPIRLISISFFYAWLTTNCKSFIPAALAHGALNGIQTGIVSNIKMNSPQIFENLTTMGIEIFVGAIFLLFMIKNKMSFQNSKIGK